jgi:hypothetical protein
VINPTLLIELAHLDHLADLNHLTHVTFLNTWLTLPMIQLNSRSADQLSHLTHLASAVKKLESAREYGQFKLTPTSQFFT